MAEKEYTYAEIAEHKTKKDLFVSINGKVYNASTFVDEHPGGEEVLMDLAGEDASEAFEDVGHSDEARETLKGLLVGTLKLMPGDPESRAHVHAISKTSNSGAGVGVGLYALVVLGAICAFAGFKYIEANKQKV